MKSFEIKDIKALDDVGINSIYVNNNCTWYSVEYKNKPTVNIETLATIVGLGIRDNTLYVFCQDGNDLFVNKYLIRVDGNAYSLGKECFDQQVSSSKTDDGSTRLYFYKEGVANKDYYFDCLGLNVFVNTF